MREDEAGCSVEKVEERHNAHLVDPLSTFLILAKFTAT